MQILNVILTYIVTLILLDWHFFGLCFFLKKNNNIHVQICHIWATLDIFLSISTRFWLLMHILVIYGVTCPDIMIHPDIMTHHVTMTELSAAMRHFLLWEYLLHVTQYLQRWHIWSVTCAHVSPCSFEGLWHASSTDKVRRFWNL